MRDRYRADDQPMDHRWPLAAFALVALLSAAVMFGDNLPDAVSQAPVIEADAPPARIDPVDAPLPAGEIGDRLPLSTLVGSAAGVGSMDGVDPIASATASGGQMLPAASKSGAGTTSASTAPRADKARSVKAQSGKALSVKAQSGKAQSGKAQSGKARSGGTRAKVPATAPVDVRPGKGPAAKPPAPTSGRPSASRPAVSRPAASATAGRGQGLTKRVTRGPKTRHRAHVSWGSSPKAARPHKAKKTRHVGSSHPSRSRHTTHGHHGRHGASGTTPRHGRHS